MPRRSLRMRAIRIRTRSLRTVQQMPPLFISSTSSSSPSNSASSTPTAPNSSSKTAVVPLGEGAVEQSGLAGAEETGEHRHRRPVVGVDVFSCGQWSLQFGVGDQADHDVVLDLG
jgi:hypothetical protein